MTPEETQNETANAIPQAPEKSEDPKSPEDVLTADSQLPALNTAIVSNTATSSTDIASTVVGSSVGANTGIALAADNSFGEMRRVDADHHWLKHLETEFHERVKSVASLTREEANKILRWLAQVI